MGDRNVSNIWPSQGIRSRIADLLSKIIHSFTAYLKSWTTREFELKTRTFIIQNLIGEGGFSLVYLVKDKSNGQLFALKRINIDLEEQLRRFELEVEAHCAVDCAHVIKLIDHEIKFHKNGRSEGLLLLPYHKHGTIQDLIDRSKEGLSLAIISKLGIDIGKGLQSFHNCEPPLAFRDLKPANILIDEDGSATLMDLGSVTLANISISSRKEALALCDQCAESSTAPFRAPELFDPPSHCHITITSDIWSFGCTLYAMAYRDTPFDGSLTATVSANFSFPANDAHPQYFRDLIDSMLQFDATARPNLIQIETVLGKMLKASKFTLLEV